MAYTTDENRIFGLDIFRAIAVLFVVISHGGFILENTFLEGFPFFSLIDGVDIFFVLSGFLIGTILLKKINETEKFGIHNLFSFWKRRWFRTLPNYYLILLINYLFVKYAFIEGDLKMFNLHFLTFTQNFKTPFYGFFWESWSLSVEEWFYIFTPILCFIILKFAKQKQAFLLTTLIMIVVPLLYRMSIHNVKMDAFWWDVTYRKVVLTRLDSIGYGLLFAWSYYYYADFWKKIKHISLILGVILVYFVLNFKQAYTSFYLQTLYFSLIPFSIMLFLPLALSIKKGKGILARITQHISLISYSMYLVHFSLVALVIKLNYPPQGGFDSLMKYLLFWVLTISISSILYRYFERPIMNLRDKKWFKKN